LLELRIFLETVCLVLILLDLTDDLCHLATLREVDEIRVVKKVWVALL
jgi:hypothetical protein